MLTTIAAGMAGGKSAGLYPTDSPDTAAFKVVHSGASIVIIEDKTKLDRLIPALSDRQYAGKVKTFVAYGYEPSANETVEYRGSKVQSSVGLRCWRWDPRGQTRSWMLAVRLCNQDTVQRWSIPLGRQENLRWEG